VLNGFVMPSDFGNDKGDKLLGIEVFYADRALEKFWLFSWGSLDSVRRKKPIGSEADSYLIHRNS
jgi:hypothetical protein